MIENPHQRHCQRGLTLIELMVVMAVSLILTLAVTAVLIAGEGQKRTTTSVNDREQSGLHAALLLDRVLRSAGSGLAQTVSVGGYGCALAASKDGVPILSAATAWPAPFAAFPAQPRVAPALIQKGEGNASDIIMVMSGSAAAGDAPRPLLAGGSASQLQLNGTLQLKGGDIVLITSGADCVIEQVKDDFTGDASTTQLDLGGDYHAGGNPLPGVVAGGASLSVLGNHGPADNHPQFMLYGVGANHELAGYDMLQMDSSQVQALADGVQRLYAVYGVDAEGRGKVSEWVDPSGDWGIDALAADPARLRKILAIRFALVLRSSTAEKKPVEQAAVPADGKIVVFGDLGEGRQRTLELSDDDRRYRYQVIDTKVPLRNALLAFAS